MAEAASRDAEFNGTKDVEERHRFNEASLDTWMRENVEGYSGSLQVSQFKGGQSNPTYRLDTPGRSYVLRRKPFGKLLPSAHAVDREYKVITALHAQGFPVAEDVWPLCTDDSVIGSMFYVMQMVEGRVFWDQTLPAWTRASAGRSSRPRSRRWQSCTATIRRRSGSATTAGRATISPARSTAGPSSTAPRRPRRSTRWNG